MENETKNLILHFEDEPEVTTRSIGLLSLNAFHENMIYSHNGKRYKINERKLNLDCDPLVTEIEFKLCK